MTNEELKKKIAQIMRRLIGRRILPLERVGAKQ